MKSLLVRWFRPVGSAQRRGRIGERAAQAHLRGVRGYRCVARNWQHGRDELDLVMTDGEVLVFVEVRARAAGALVPGLSTIGPKKRRALLRAARAYIRGLRTRPRTIRFDVVEVDLDGEKAAGLRHFENIPIFALRELEN